MFKPIAALNYMIQCMFFAQMYHLKVSALWIVIMIVTCVILSVATTPIPGGGMAIYAVIFTQLGIPSEALAIALACESVFDYNRLGSVRHFSYAFKSGRKTQLC